MILPAMILPTIFSQATPTAGSFLQFWLAIALVANVFMAIAVIVSSLSNRKQRREVNQAFEPAGKQDFEQYVRDSETNFLQVRNEMREDRIQNQTNASFRTAALYKKIDEIRRELSDKIDHKK